MYCHVAGNWERGFWKVHKHIQTLLLCVKDGIHSVTKVEVWADKLRVLG